MRNQAMEDKVVDLQMKLKMSRDCSAELRAENERLRAALRDIMNNQNDFCTTCDENVDTAALALQEAP